MLLLASACQMCVFLATENLCSGVGCGVQGAPCPGRPQSPCGWVRWWAALQSLLCLQPWPVLLGVRPGGPVPFPRAPASEPCHTLGRYRVGGVSVPPRTTASGGTWDLFTGRDEAQPRAPDSLALGWCLGHWGIAPSTAGDSEAGVHRSHLGKHFTASRGWTGGKSQALRVNCSTGSLSCEGSLQCPGRDRVVL